MLVSDNELKALHVKLIQSEWNKIIRLSKRKDRHNNIDFTNPRHEQLKANVKQEIEKRGLK